MSGLPAYSNRKADTFNKGLSVVPVPTGKQKNKIK